MAVTSGTFEYEFPCSLVINLPLPTHRLAFIAQQALQVDKELSPLVQRSITIIRPSDSSEASILCTRYKATTNRMLRVAVNGFMESLTVVLGIMEEFDIDMLDHASAT